MADTVQRYWIDPDGNPFLTTSDGATTGASEAYVNDAVSAEALLRAAADSDLQDQIDELDDREFDLAAAIHSASSKNTPANSDEFALSDSSEYFGLKKLTWADIKAALPPAGLTTLGGVKRNVGSAGQFVTGIASDGSLERGTPAGGGGTTSVAYAATVTPNADTTENLIIGALTGNLTIANPTGTPEDFQVLKIRIKQDGTGGRMVTLESAYRLPTGGAIEVSTGSGETSYLGFLYNAVDSVWDVMSLNPGYPEP